MAGRIDGPTLADFLLRRAFASSFDRRDREVERFPNLTRRAFMGSTSSLGAAALAVARDPLSPQISQRGRTLTVQYGGSTWTIDGALFGNAAPSWSHGPHDIVIALAGATLPGTDLDVSFRARLFARASGWHVHLTIPSLGFEAAAALGLWLDGAATLEAPIALRRIAAGGSTIEIAGREVRLDLRPTFGLSIGGPDVVVTVDGPAGSTGQRLSLDVAPAGAAALRRALHSALDGPVTACALFSPRIAAPSIPLAWHAATCALGCSSDGPTALTGEVYGCDTGDEGVWMLEGSLRLHLETREPGADDPAQIRFEHSALMMTSGRRLDERVLAGRVTRATHAVDTGGAHLRLSGDDERPFFAHFRDGRAGDIRFQARLHEAWLPFDGADTARLDFAGRLVDIVVAEAEGAAVPDPETSRSLIMLGREPFLAFSLDPATLTIRRGTDLLNLTFQFSGLDLKVYGGRPFLVRRQPPKGQPPSDTTLTVVFPPQHLAETVTEAPDPDPCFPPALPAVSQARLSSGSRVVFKVCETQWARQELTIEALTDWSDLGILANQRALDADASFETQMKIPGIDATTTLDQYLPLVSNTLQPPGARETALAMSARLIVSPPAGAMFSTPRGRLDRSAAPLWHARLDERWRSSVRAIWSQQLVPGRMLDVTEMPPSGADQQSLGALSADHHREIVGQSSVYGLTALRRIVDPNDPPVDEVQTALKNLPRSRVVRPEPDFLQLQNLDSIKTFTHKDSGFALAQPFNDADIILTSIGGSFVANWHGEPPHTLQLTKGFNLERLGYWSQLSREIFVEVISKGFALPLGHRCSLIELTERRFFPHPDTHAPTAYLVKRRFIVFGKPEKVLPGVSQPFDGRDFPAKRVVMQTRQSPDLLAPEPGPSRPNAFGQSGVSITDGGALTFTGPDMPAKTPLVFWPRVQMRTTNSIEDVQFKWTVDGDPSPITSNLLFVSNSALSLEPLVARIVDHYRALSRQWTGLRTARLGGARRRYADPSPDRDTAFDTDTWILNARGRILPTPTGEGEDFVMDGRMEGADQPPFYPFVEEARVNVQSLDRLLGRPQGLIRVAFNPVFVRNEWVKNPAEIFLNVLGPDIALDVTGQGDSAGGVAKPNARVAALSRKLGVVGGTKPTAEAAPPGAAVPMQMVTGTRPAALATPPGATPDSPYNFDSALQGQFNPAEFFDSLLDAKLLGLIPLREVVKAVIPIDGAPKLVESLGYGAAGAANDAVKALQDVFGPPLKAANDALAKFLATVAGQQAFADLYPEIVTGISGFSQATGAAATAVTNAKQIDDLLNVVPLVTKVVARGNELIAAIAAVLHDPVPRQIRQELDKLAGAWTTMKALAASEFASVGQKLLDEAMKTGVEDFCAAVWTAGLGQAVLGIDKEMPCDYLLEHPADAAAEIESALFANVVARPLLNALIAVRDFKADVSGRVPWARRVVAKAALGAVQSAVADLTLTLQLDPQSVITFEVSQKTLAQNLFNAVVKAVDDAKAAPDSKDPINDTLKAIDDAVGTHLRTELDAVIRAASDEIKAQPSVDPVQLLNDLVDRVGAALHREAARAVTNAVDLVRKRVLARAGELRADAIAEIESIAAAAIDGITSTAVFAQIVTAAADLQGWCGNVAGKEVSDALKFADDMAGQMMASSGALVTTLSGIDFDAQHLTLPSETPPDIHQRFDQACTDLKKAQTVLAKAVADVEAGRQALAKIRDDVDQQKYSVCTDLPKFLGPTAELISQRARALDQVPDVLTRIAAVAAVITFLDSVVNTLPPADQPKIRAAIATAKTRLDSLVGHCRDLYKDISSIRNAAQGASAAWTNVTGHINRLLPPATLNSEYQQSLADARDALVTTAAALSSALDAAGVDPDRLKAAASSVAQFTAKQEKELTALVLETVAIGVPIAQQLEVGTKHMLAGAAGALLKLHTTAADAFGNVVTFLTADPFISVLVNPAVVDSFKKAKTRIDADVVLLTQLANSATTLTDAIRAARELVNERWRPISDAALLSGLKVLTDLAENILRGNLAALLNTDLIKEAARALESALRDFLVGLVPTRADLTYDWATSLDDAPNKLFAIDEPGSDALTLNAHISIDFISGKRTSTVIGALKPFTINLFGADPSIVALHFKKLTFTSVDGHTPQFDVKLASADLGKALTFLKPLQAWLSPDGGFYVNPTTNPPGVTAGYTFATDVIPLGPLLFLNVALDIGVELPFSNAPAKFNFTFASPDKPFIIAAPPYGGSGWLQFSASRGDSGIAIKKFALSFSFGGCVPIKFGPLSASGRLMAGIYLIQTPDGREMGAFVEAVGEGHIACFGISVCIQVGLRDQSSTGTLQGFTSFSLEFKMGFITLKYSFTAVYTVHSGSNSAIASARLASIGNGFQEAETVGPCVLAQLDPNARAFRALTPNKATQWNQYRERLAMHLLDS